MTTTAVFAEILVGGLEALIWVALIALSIARQKIDVDTMSKMHDWAAPVVPVVLAVAYTLGIVVDRVADSAFRQWIPKPWNESKLRLRVLARGDKVTDFIEYIRSRLRVARVTALNLILITITAPLCLCLCDVGTPPQTLATFVALAVLTGMSFFTMRRIGETYKNRLQEAAALPPPAKKS